MNSDLVLVIPHWQARKLVKDATNRLSEGYSFIIVDNSQTLKMPGGEGKPEVITPYSNLGFAAACNRAFYSVDKQFLLFLNPDTQLKSGDIEQLCAYLDANHLDATSPLMVDHSGNTQEHYLQPVPSISYLFLVFSPAKVFLRILNYRAKTLPGGCILIRRSALERLRGWDERFWLWWEDSDLSYRFKEAEMKFGVASHVKVTHEGGQSFRNFHEHWKRWVFFHSLRIFIRKHFPRWQQVLLFLLLRRFDNHKLYPADENIDVSVIVPNVRIELLKEFLKNSTAHWDWQRHELIVVTAASDILSLRKLYPHVVFIQLDKSAGFASTVNIGFRRARGLWLATANDDTILPPDLWDKLLACADEKTGSINPVIYKPDGSIESAGIRILKKGKAQPITKIQDKDHCYETDATNAAVVLYNREALEKVGLFDERFGSYLEDIDLSLRLKRAGYTNVVVPKARAVHIGQSTSKKLGRRKQWYDFRNWILVILKNWTLLDILINFPAIFAERLRNFWGIWK